MFSVWRAVRLWRDPQYYERLVTLGLFRFSPRVTGGIARGWVPFAFSIVSLAVGLSLLIVGETADGGSSSPELVVAGLALVGVFLIGVVLHIVVIWTNRPRRLVPPYLRDAPGLRKVPKMG